MSSLQELLSQQRENAASAAAFETVSQRREAVLSCWRGFWLFESPVDSPLMKDGQALRHGPVASGARQNCELYVTLQEESPAEYLGKQNSVFQSKSLAGLRLPPAVLLHAVWTQGSTQFIIKGKLNQSLTTAEDCTVHRRVRIPLGCVVPPHEQVSWQDACTPAKIRDDKTGDTRTVSVNVADSSTSTLLSMAYDTVTEFVSPCCLQLFPKRLSKTAVAQGQPSSLSAADDNDSDDELLVIRFDRFVAKPSPSGRCVARRNPFPRLWVLSQTEEVEGSSLGERNPPCGQGAPRSWSVCPSTLNNSTIQLALAAQRRAARKGAVQIWLPTLYASRSEGISDDILPKYPNVKVISTDDFDNHVLNGDFAVYWYNPQSSLALGMKARELLETSLGSTDRPASGVVLAPLPRPVVDLLKARRVNFFHIEAQFDIPKQEHSQALEPSPSTGLTRSNSLVGNAAYLDEIGDVQLCSAGWSCTKASFSSIEMGGAVISHYAISKHM